MLFRSHLPDRLALAGEFFRWEFATATAGWLLGVNPFDEPNVQQAKDATKRLLDSYTNRGRLPTDEVEQLRGGAVATVSRALKAAGRTAGGILQSLTPGDYVGVLAYAPPDEPDVVQAIEGLRQRIASRTGHVATMGFGPRYLHSTGQLHKGGANTGVFIVITTPPTADMPIPGSPYSFGVQIGRAHV